MVPQRGASRVGSMFGHYQIRALIGSGGMGEVYEAYDTAKDRIVALKLLRPEFAADPSFQERFRRESRLAARLREPHVIPVHDWGEINGVLYIDMRLVEGRSLNGVLRSDGPLEPRRTAAILEQVAGALDAAHGVGLVHRDIKPDNVLLTANDFAYLVDFGIAHIGGDTGLTSAGSAVGSLLYMAPERFTGDPVGPPADIYSLACVLYECLTAQTPFPSGDVTQMMGAHVMRPPPRPSAGRPGLNLAFDEIIAQGMDKRPELRFASAGALARAASAAAWAQPPTQQAPTSRPQEQRRASPQPSIPAGPYAPYPEHVDAPQLSQGRRGFGLGQTVLAVAAALLLGAALVVVLWAIFGNKRDQSSANSSGSPIPLTTMPTTEQTTSSPSTESTSPPNISGLPGTDGLGFIGYPGARCDPGSQPAAEARTTQSLVVVCQTSPGSFYYRGLRLSDGAGIELADAVRSSGGFDVTNPTDQTRYQVRPTVVNIIGPDGQVSSEPVIQYTSN